MPTLSVLQTAFLFDFCSTLTLSVLISWLMDILSHLVFFFCPNIHSGLLGVLRLTFLGPNLPPPTHSFDIVWSFVLSCVLIFVEQSMWSPKAVLIVMGLVSSWFLWNINLKKFKHATYPFLGSIVVAIFSGNECNCDPNHNRLHAKPHFDFAFYHRCLHSDHPSCCVPHTNSTQFRHAAWSFLASIWFHFDSTWPCPFPDCPNLNDCKQAELVLACDRECDFDPT